MKGLIFFILCAQAAVVTFPSFQVHVRHNEEFVEKSKFLDPKKDVTCEYKATGWSCQAEMNTENAMERKIYIICKTKIIEGSDGVDEKTCDLIFDLHDEDQTWRSLAVPIVGLVVLLFSIFFHNGG